MPQNFKKTAKVKIVEAIANVSSPEIGELYYDATTNRIYIWTVAGWKYAGFS